MPSRIKGAASLRRLMKRMPDAVQLEINQALDQWGGEIERTMRARAHFRSRTGRLIAAIRHKMFPRTMRMQVGIIGSQKLRNRLFYGRILDLGRKGKRVLVRRRSAGGATSSYALNVKAISPMRFVSGPITDLRAGLDKHLGNIWQRVLTRVSAGVGDD